MNVYPCKVLHCENETSQQTCGRITTNKQQTWMYTRKKKNTQGNIYTSSGVPEQEDVNQKHIYNSNEPARRR